MTPPAAEDYFSRATLTDLLCEKFTACRVKSSLHLDNGDDCWRRYEKSALSTLTGTRSIADDNQVYG